MKSLKVAWTYHSRDGEGNVQCNPIIVDGILSLVQRAVVSPGLTGKFGKQRDNRPVVSTTARGDASDTASPTDRADDQREALV